MMEDKLRTWFELKIKEQEERLTQMRAELKAMRMNLEIMEEKVEKVMKVIKNG